MKSYIKPVQKVVLLDETEMICGSKDAPADSQSLDDVFGDPATENFDSDVKGKNLWDGMW